MNLVRSARARIALITALVCAVVLGAFAVAAWSRLKSARIEALDRELESAGISLALSARMSLPAATAERLLNQRFGSEREKGRAFSVIAQGEKAVLSSQWPSGLDPASLPHNPGTIEREMGGPPDDGGPRSRAVPPDGIFGPPPDEPGGGPRGWPRDSADGGPPRMDDRFRERPRRPLLYKPAFSTVEAGGKTWRAGVFGHAGSGIIVRVMLDEAVFAADLRDTARSFMLTVPGALLLIAAGAWFAAWRSLAPVKELTRRIETVSLGKQNARLELAGADTEFRPILGAWNEMLERMERSYRQATRFSADASHELKTPLAVMRATIEHALTQCPDGSAEQRTYAGLLDELDQLQAIIEGLLLLSRADAGLLATSRETLDLTTWLQPLLEDAGLMAEERGIRVEAEITEGIRVQADPVLLTRAVHNLLRNAVAYNHEDGEIRADLSRSAGMALLRISNTGEPVAEEERAHIFERFKRGTNAGGTGQGKGLGIGLSLAREIALAHGGSLTHESAGGLTTFCLSLPLAT
jgi:two-component system heavy metal sensor histidine kinase CusS